MYSKEYQDVTDFHVKFDIDYEGKPRLLPEELQRFREKFLDEELDEFKKAFESKDLAKAFDALIDLAYVLYGTAHLMGLPWNQGWNLVHQANMTKRKALNASESKRGYAMDVVKPEGWISPDGALRRLIREMTKYS